jgi:ParB family chromosome partitioning protein
MAQQNKYGPQVERLHAVAGSLAGRLVAIGGEREGVVATRVHVLQLPTGAAVLSAPVAAPVHALRFLADDLLVAGSTDGTLTCWDAGAEKPSPEPIHALASAHAGAIRALACDLAGKQLVSVGDDGTLRLFELEVEGGRPRLVLRGDRRLSARPLRAVGIDPVSPVVVAAGDDGVIRSLPLADLAGATPREMPCGEGGIFALALSGDGRVAAGCGDGSLRVCYLEGATDEDNRSGDAAHTAPVRALCFGPLLRDEAGRELQRRLLSVGEDGQLKAWLLDQRRKPRTLDLGSSPIHGMAWLPASSRSKAESRGGTLAAGGR